MSPLAELHRSLDAALVFGPTWNGHLSNHLPMALHAAWELGAEVDRLQAQLQHDAPKLERAPPSELETRIAVEIETYGAEAVLHRHVPQLVSMPHAGLFHGMIRTAHAWESGHARELAAALAYWTALWRPQPAVADAAAVPNVADAGDEPWKDVRKRR